MHRLDRRWNWLVPALFATWAAIGWGILALPSGPGRWPGYVAAGLVLHAFGILMHDGVHGDLFRRRGLDRLVGFLLGLPLLVSFSAYRAVHLRHHRRVGTEGDPDQFALAGMPRWLVVATYYAWPVLGLPMYVLHVPQAALATGTRAEKKDVTVECLVIGAVLAGAVLWARAAGRSAALVHAWLIPYVLTGFVNNARGWAEHVLGRPGDPLTETRTITTNRLVSAVMLHINFHLEHHLLPSLPWYRLRLAHDLLADPLAKRGAEIRRSYVVQLWHAALKGPYGVRPAPRSPRPVG